MTDAAFPPLRIRIATVLALALLLAPLPAGAAGGGGQGGGGMGGGRGSTGGVFHVRGGGGAARGGDVGGPRPGRTDAARDAAPAIEAGFGRGVGEARGAGRVRTAEGKGGHRSVARRTRPALRRFLALRRRSRTSRCDRTLYERYHAPHSCRSSRAYGRSR